MKGWLRIACVEELPLESGKTIEVNGKRVAIFHLKMGFFMLDDHCRYPDGYLGDGKVLGQAVSCLLHGCRFNIISGECLDNKDFQLGTYRVKTQGSDVFVQMS